MSCSALYQLLTWSDAIPTPSIGILRHTHPLPRCLQLAQELVAAVRDMCVALGHSRYKYAVHVTYGQRANQGSLLSSKCLWDGQTDGYVTATIVNETLFCSCQVACVMWER